jgi:hypothetical protein
MSSNLEARVKALEDWQQAIARATVAPPTPQQTQPAPSTDETVCPGFGQTCGKIKQAKYKYCFTCNEKAKAAK